MSMQSYASRGHLLPINKETLDKFTRISGKIRSDLLQEIEDDGLGFDPMCSENWHRFSDAFKQEYYIHPDCVVLCDDQEGFSGIADLGVFLMFEEDDKYIRTVREEWKALPIEPEESSWTTFS
jgi:hypothetical protein